MKISTAICAVLSSNLVAAGGLSFLGGSQKALAATGEPVPGESPLVHCNAAHDDNLLLVDHINLSPNPPTPGNTLTIEAVGTLKETLEEGAYVILQVKYGLIRLINTKQDLCEQVSNVDLECPVKDGKIVIQKDIDLPNEIPPGKYEVFADAYTVDGRKLICLTASIVFSRG